MYLKKLLCIFLIISFIPVQSVCGSENYDAHWAKEAIDFVKENEIWPASLSINPDKPVAREVLAYMVKEAVGSKQNVTYRGFYEDVPVSSAFSEAITAVTKMGVMKGDGKTFRPNDSLTREEFAVILDRIYMMMEPNNKNAVMEPKRFIDFEEISAWAQQSVFNAVERGVLRGVTAKTFIPKKLTTCAEAATVMMRVMQAIEKATQIFTVKNAPNVDEVKKQFPVLVKTKVLSQAGICGVGLLAEFDGAPKEIYLSRTTTTQTIMGGGTPYAPSALAAVTDPDGTIVAEYDFSDLTNGKKDIIMNIPEGKAGIWSIQLMNGCTGDTFEIGIRKCDYWGIRGEKAISVADLGFKMGYIWAPKTAKFIYLSSSTTDPIGLYSNQGVKLMESTAASLAFTKHHLNYKTVTPETVYGIKLDTVKNAYVMIDGVPGLICPTKEAAEHLKGGWIEVDHGILVQGAVQAKAREEIVRLATTKNLNVIINKPESVPQNVENPMIEAQLFGAYAPISSLSNAINFQNVNPESFMLGRCDKKDDTSVGDFQSGIYENPHFQVMNTASSMAISASIPLELNYCYGNEALITRAAMGLLYTGVYMSEGGIIRDYVLDGNGNSYPSTSNVFGFTDWIEGYDALRGFVEPQTRLVLDETFKMLINKQCNYRGQGATNQYVFHIFDNLKSYEITGEERFHNAFKRQMEFLFGDGKMAPHLGYRKPGYFLEAGGCDGSYQYMNESLVYKSYLLYREMDNADKNLLKLIEDCVQEANEFASFFWSPQPEDLYYKCLAGDITEVVPPSHFQTRTDNQFGIASDPAYESIMHINPLARRRFLMERNSEDNPLGFSPTYPMRINNKEWALQHIEKFYPDYEKFFEKNAAYNRLGKIWVLDNFRSFTADEYPEPSMLPCEAPDDTIWDKRGLIAFKHAGIYGLCFYHNGYTTSGSVSYCYQGGGPSQLWSAGTGTTLCSQKHLNYKDYGKELSVNNPDDVVSTCIMGTLEDGTFITTGREGVTPFTTEMNKLEWIEPNKKFSISGNILNSPKTATWTYDLAEDCLLITAKISPVKAKEEFWLNLPMAIAGTELDKSELENGKLSVCYKDSKMTYSWDENLEVKLLDNIVKTYSEIARLRVKMPESGEITFKIKNEGGK